MMKYQVQRPNYPCNNILHASDIQVIHMRMYILLLLLFFLPKAALPVASLYHTIKHANVIAEMIATTLARATEAGPRASAPQQGRL